MTLTTYDKLLPCPLCGDRPDVLIRKDGTICVFCNDCDLSAGDFGGEQEAVDGWNNFVTNRRTHGN